MHPVYSILSYNSSILSSTECLIAGTQVADHFTPKDCWIIMQNRKKVTLQLYRTLSGLSLIINIAYLRLYPFTACRNNSFWSINIYLVSFTI